MNNAAVRLFFAVVMISGGALALGAKLGLIRAYGSDVPYMDEWDVVGGLLLIPSAQGQLHARDFLQAQNEHRIVLTRLLAYGIESANRQWDPLLEMTVNAAIHAALCSALLLLARRLVSGAPFVMAAVVLSLLFAPPFAWENTLQGLQSQYYLLLWAALGLFLLCVSGAPLSARWWAGWAIGVAGLGTVASGFVAPAVVLLLIFIRREGGRRRGSRALVATFLLASFFAVGLLSIRRMPGHDDLGAHSLGEWATAWAGGLSWPAGAWPVAFVILQLPVMILLYSRRREGRRSPHEEVLAALALWTWAQVAIIAFGRAHLGMMRSRYMDIYAMASAVNVIALAVLLTTCIARRQALVLAVAWMAVFSFGLWGLVRQTHLFYLDSYRAQKSSERAQVRGFLQKRDPATLRNAPARDLPYPDAGTLIALLADPAVQAKLPAGIRLPVALAPAAGSRGFQLEATAESALHSGTRTWVARKGPARFVSQPFSEDHLPFLHVTLRGSPDLDASVFHLESAQRTRALDAFSLQGERWHGADIAVPAGPSVRVVVTLPPGDHWLAFEEPVELGAGTWVDRWLLRRSLPITAAALLVFAAALAVVFALDLAAAKSGPTPQALPLARSATER